MHTARSAPGPFPFSALAPILFALLGCSDSTSVTLMEARLNELDPGAPHEV